MTTPCAFGWWDTGHAYITDSAVQHLPAPLKSFVSANLNTVRTYARNEPPGLHFIDIDSYPEWSNPQTFPRDINVLIAAHGSSFVTNTGTAPWRVGQYMDDLSAAMAAANTGAKWAATLKNFGEMAHYIEDLHNPLHTTENYNGQLTNNLGIHARYEGEMIQRHFADLPVSLAPVEYRGDMVDSLLDSIETTYFYNADIMSADNAARAGGTLVGSELYYAKLWDGTDHFTPLQFQRASEMVADAWYSAWVDAGSPTPILPEPGGLALLVLIAGGLSRRSRAV